MQYFVMAHKPRTIARSTVKFSQISYHISAYVLARCRTQTSLHISTKFSPDVEAKLHCTKAAKF